MQKSLFENENIVSGSFSSITYKQDDQVIVLEQEEEVQEPESLKSEVENKEPEAVKQENTNKNNLKNSEIPF